MNSLICFVFLISLTPNSLNSQSILTLSDFIFVSETEETNTLIDQISDIQASSQAIINSLFFLIEEGNFEYSEEENVIPEEHEYNPCDGDPCCGSICCWDPCCGDPCCGDPCCRDPCCGDPCCFDPCCGNPC